MLEATTTPADPIRGQLPINRGITEPSRSTTPRSGIELVNIGKDYEGRTALADVSLSISPGEFVSIVGPSGSGKSTLLKIIAGIEPQDRGSVLISDICVDRAAPQDRDIAMVFQSYALYPHLSARRNIGIPLLMRRLSQLERLPVVAWFSPRRKRVLAEIDAEVRRTASLLGIEGLLDRKPGKMSGGQRQRVALGRAIIRQPSVFLLDEPLSNLDAALKLTMCAELKALQRRLGVTCLYVTHDQVEAMKMSDRMAVILDGRVLQVDRPDMVYRWPAHRRVAEFIGTPLINFLPVKVLGDQRVAVAGISTRIRTAGSPCAAGLRPEALFFTTQASSTLPGRIESVERLGSETLFTVSVHTGTVSVRQQAFDCQAAQVGELVNVGFRDDQVSLFGADGSRLALVTSHR
jgi:multiple sugar transport system ATP-binding protein